MNPISIMGVLPLRGSDEQGSGYFGAPRRGGRTHNGIDIAAPPGTEILSPIDGKVTKHGYPYKDDLTFRYIQITSSQNFHHRFFYLDPLLELGADAEEGFIIGRVQDLTSRYRGITSHFHYEIKTEWGEYLNPTELYLQENSTAGEAQAKVVKMPPAFKRYLEKHRKGS